MTLITTAEAAGKLGVHRTRVQVLIRTGRLPALLIGGTYVIEEKDLALVANRKPGRPPLTDVEKAARAEKRVAAADVRASLFEPAATMAKQKFKAGEKKTIVNKVVKRKGGVTK